MSDTPRTDERAVTHPWVNGEAKYVAVEFACELERENATLRAALDNIRTKIADAAKGDCRKLHDFERIALAMKEAQP